MFDQSRLGYGTFKRWWVKDKASAILKNPHLLPTEDDWDRYMAYCLFSGKLW